MDRDIRYDEMNDRCVVVADLAPAPRPAPVAVVLAQFPEEAQGGHHVELLPRRDHRRRR